MNYVIIAVIGKKPTRVNLILILISAVTFITGGSLLGYGIHLDNQQMWGVSERADILIPMGSLLLITGFALFIVGLVLPKKKTMINVHQNYVNGWAYTLNTKGKQAFSLKYDEILNLTYAENAAVLYTQYQAFFCYMTFSEYQKVHECITKLKEENKI